MKVLAVTTAFAGLTAVSALPFWQHTRHDPPELTVDEWQAIQTGDFNALPMHPTHTPSPSGLWDKIKSVVTSPFGVPDTLVEAIGSYVDSYIDDTVEYFDDDSEKTIWQLLQEDDEHYSKIVKLLKLEETGKAVKVLDNRDLSITFFAPENSGIPDPHHHDDDDDDDGEDCDDEDEDALFESLMAEPSPASLLEAHNRFFGGDGDHDDDKKKRRHKIFQFILRAVLKYHGLPEAYSSLELAMNNTFATALRPKFGVNDGRPLRIRVEKKLVPPTLEINFYSKVSQADVKAKNGYIHRINHPLLPPPPILDAAFLFPSKFSTWTSAVQKVHGQHHVGWHLDHEASKKEHKPVFHGNAALTYFIPTNDAFAKLPEKLIFFLFSPFGERALAKVLAYHGLPEQVVFTEHVFDVKHPHDHDGDHKHHHDHDGKHKHHHDHDGKHHHHHHDHDGKHHHHHDHDGKHHHHHDKLAALDDDPSFHKEFEFTSGLEKEKLKVVIDKSKVLPVPGATKTTLSVNDVSVDTFDVPALNGVAHVLPEVLKPPHKHKDHKSGLFTESTWDNWEDWLVDWAESH